MKREWTEMARPADIAIGIVVFGSLWGLTEVVVDGVVRAAGLPYRAALLTGIGMGLMAAGVAAYNRLWLPVAGAGVAVAVKLLVVPILHVPASCKANSSLAVALEALALAAAVAVVGRGMRSTKNQVAAGVMAALGSATAFWAAGMRLAPCNYLLSFNRPGGLLAFMAAEGVPWALASALLVPVGYWLGARIRQKTPEWQQRPSLYYLGSGAIAACCWVASAFAIAAGL
ncbi:MAG: hypothetical protein JSW37_01525 [Anaerolineales bacterium]|nr:MAG: hypothetical protein JSW37_01525 [Anaerolineales bacterium]